MSVLKQDDLDQDFNINNGAIVETRAITYPLLPDGFPSVSIIDGPWAVQIPDTQPSRTAKVGKRRIKERSKYNRSIVVILGASKNRGQSRAAGRLLTGKLIYKVWTPVGEDPTKAGSTWVPWKSASDHPPTNGLPVSDTLLKKGTVEVSSKPTQSHQIVIRGTLATGTDYRWTGICNTSGDIQWTGAPE